MREQLIAAAAMAAAVAAAAPAEQLFSSQGTQPGGLDGGVPFGDAVNDCASCHDRSATLGDGAYMPFDSWVGTMMANSLRDPLFLAALTVAQQDAAGIGEWCIRCHSPAAFVRGDAWPGDGSRLDDIDRQGVSCDVCHRARVDPNDPKSPYLWNAQILFDPMNTKHGPYGDNPSPAHDVATSAFAGRSELCAHCHQVANPLVRTRDESGADTGQPFALDTTYEEWKQSSWASPGGKHCPDCHMPRHAGMLPVGKFGPLRDDPRTHRFAGGNAWGVDAVIAANPAWAATYAEAFAATRAAAVASLQSAATLEVDPLAARVGPGDRIAVRVRVTNRTGHKLPTGYADGRRVWVELTVDSPRGATVASIGAYDAAAARLPEHPQLRVYEALHGIYGRGPEEHLAQHDTVVKDSRIPPAGFSATRATRPVGTTWFDDGAGGLRYYDEAVYDLPAPAEPGPATVWVRLWYQSTTREYVEFLERENRTDGRGAELKRIWEATARAAPVEMARVEHTVTVDGPPRRGCGCATGAGAAPMVAAAAAALARWRSSRRRRR